MRGFLLLLVLIFLCLTVCEGKKKKKCRKERNELKIQVAELKKQLEEIGENKVDGGWSDFEDWSECSVTCGGGIQERRRTCTSPPPSNGGASCAGDNVEAQSCNAQSCAANKNCAELYKSGQTSSGVYTIDPDGSGAFDVFCDQTTAGGEWTVFQKRLDGSVDFYRGWADYKNGFGDLNGEFWLGLDKIHRLTGQQYPDKLRVDLEDWDGNSAFAEYDGFAVGNAATKYKLSFGAYSGTAGDSLSYSRGQVFSTKDQDNDSSGSNCAVKYKGAWWYKSCHYSNLNGLYHHGAHSSFADGINWRTWKGNYYSAKRTEMKIRPAEF